MAVVTRARVSMPRAIVASAGRRAGCWRARAARTAVGRRRCEAARCDGGGRREPRGSCSWQRPLLPNRALFFFGRECLVFEFIIVPLYSLLSGYIPSTT